MQNTPQNELVYRIVFSGEVSDGVSFGDAKSKVCALFKLDNKTVEALFSSKRTIVKKNLNYSEAQKYQKAFLKCGAVCEIVKQSKVDTEKTISDSMSGKAKCDICLGTVPDREGYVLKTVEVVTEPNYWSVAFRGAGSSIEMMPKDAVKEMFENQIKQQCSQETGWLTCKKCISKFPKSNIENSRQYAAEYWMKLGEGSYSPPEGGAVDPDKAMLAATTAWEKETGKQPPITTITTHLEGITHEKKNVNTYTSSEIRRDDIEYLKCRLMNLNLWVHIPIGIPISNIDESVIIETDNRSTPDLELRKSIVLFSKLVRGGVNARMFKFFIENDNQSKIQNLFDNIENIKKEFRKADIEHGKYRLPDLYIWVHIPFEIPVSKYEELVIVETDDNKTPSAELLNNIILFSIIMVTMHSDDFKLKCEADDWWSIQTSFINFLNSSNEIENEDWRAAKRQFASMGSTIKWNHNFSV